MSSALSMNDATELLLKVTERVEWYWNFFVVITLALIGWLIAQKKPLVLPLKLLVTVAYLIAAGMNLLGVYGSYTFAEALRADVLAMASRIGAEFMPATRAVLEGHSYLWQRTAAIVIHVIIGVGVLAAIWLARFGEATAAKRVDGRPG
jgi:hypothetical protein